MSFLSSSLNYHQVFFIPNRIHPDGDDITGSAYSTAGEPHNSASFELNNVVYGTFTYIQGEST